MTATGEPQAMPALCILVTPSAAGTAWRQALTLRAVQLGWPVHDTGLVQDFPSAGLVFAHSFAEMDSFGAVPRIVLTDTSAGDPDDPSLPASTEAIMIRSQSLAEAESAAINGASVLNAARYVLQFPAMGTIERPEGMPYRIDPSVAESPLAVFDDRTPGTRATWLPRWFSYPGGYAGSPEQPLIDLTGKMRPIIYGPYICLPAGRWRVDLEFTVDPERAHAPLLFEWGFGNDYCRVVTEIRHRGRYAVSLDRVWPQADAAQLRIWTAHPVFQGQFGFGGCRVTRMAMDDPAAMTPLDRIVDAGVL